MSRQKDLEVSVEEILCRAREIIEKNGWHTGSLAQDGAGKNVRVRSPDAASFCAVGAVRRAAHELDLAPYHPIINRALRRLARAIKRHGGYNGRYGTPFDTHVSVIEGFNDTRGPNGAGTIKNVLCEAVREERGEQPESTL